MAPRNPAVLGLALWMSLTPELRARQESRFARVAAALDQSTFVAFSDEEVAASRANLLQALSNAPVGVPAVDWLSLEPNDVSRAIEVNADDVNRFLDRLIAKLIQDRTPFEHQGLLELRQHARHYNVVLENQRNRGEVKQSFDRARKTAGEALTRYEQTRSPVDFEQIAAEVRWCQRHEQAAEFVKTTKEELSLPNLEFCLPAELVRTASRQQATLQTEAVNRDADGIQTIGTMDVWGQWYLEPAAAYGGGILTVQFQGGVRFSATNTRRRIQFATCGYSQVAAVAQVAIDNQPFVTTSVLDANAATGLQNGPVTVNQCLFARPIARLADRLIARKTPEIESALSQEVANAARAKLATQLEELAAKANAFVRDDFVPKARRLDLPTRVSVSTTQHELRFHLTEDEQCGLAADAPCPSPPDGLNFGAIHQTLMTDLMNAAYVRQNHPQNLDVNALQVLNEVMHKTVPFGPFREVAVRNRNDVSLSLELDFPRPFLVSFQRGHFGLTFRARQLRLRGEPVYPAHDVTLDYRLSVQTDGAVHFEKVGDPRVIPREGGRDAPSELVAAVRNELFADLRPAFTVEPGRFFSGGWPLPLGVRAFTVDQGWLAGSLEFRLPGGRGAEEVARH
jgi:hypothetical protein